MEFKRCGGYGGHWACDYPDHMVPVGEFAKCRQARCGLQGMCRKCQKYRDKTYIAGLNSFIKWQHESRGASQSAMRKYNKDHPEERKADYERWLALGLNNQPNVTPIKTPKPTFGNSGELIESRAWIRKRDQNVGKAIRTQYDSCSVVGCDYSDYDVAHIYALKHGADDLPENCLALCPNHHRDLDRGRMVLTHPHLGVILFTRENKRELNVYTTGQIILQHEVDPKNIDQCNLELEEWKNAGNA